MRIKVLGCHGSEAFGTDPAGRRVECHPSGFLFDDSVLVDAGTVATAEDPTGVDRIRHIFLSHTHFDHIQALPALADRLAGRASVTIYSVPEVLESLHTHLLNDRIWPDFTRIPNVEHPTFRLTAVEEERPRVVDALRLTPVRVNHTVPTVGYVIQSEDAAVLYSGDTHETRRIWEAAARTPHLKAALIEASFPDELSDLALRSGHLTPRLLGQEFAKIGRPDIALYVYHLKPRYLPELRAQLQALKLPNLRILADGDILTV